MSYYELSADMQYEVKKLASEYSINLNEAYKYYLMGGYEHGKKLCKLKSMDISDKMIELYNCFYWDEKNKKIWEALNKLTPWYSKLWFKIKNIFNYRT